MTDPAGRSSAIDPLRVLLALSVIALHSGFPDAAPPLVKQVLFNGLYRLAVPVFALISGYFFLGAMQAGRVRATLGRLLGLYALWMAIYLPFWGPDVTGMAHLARMLVFGYFHLWFLPGLLVGAVIVALLRRPPLVACAAGLAALTGLALQFAVLSGRAEIALDHYRNGLFAVFPFFALGWLMAHHVPAGIRRHAGPLAGLGLLAVMGESLIWHAIAGGGWGVDMMASLPVAAPLLFLAARGLRGAWDGKRLAATAAFVYFTHVLMMIAASRFGLTGDAKALVVMALCLGLAIWLGRARHRPVLAFLT